MPMLCCIFDVTLMIVSWEVVAVPVKGNAMRYSEMMSRSYERKILLHVPLKMHH